VAKKYLVGNPRGIPEGTCILSFRTAPDVEDFFDMFEGDKWVRPAQVDAKEEKELIQRGFLVEVA